MKVEPIGPLIGKFNQLIKSLKFRNSLTTESSVQELYKAYRESSGVSKYKHQDDQKKIPHSSQVKNTRNPKQSFIVRIPMV